MIFKFTITNKSLIDENQLAEKQTLIPMKIRRRLSKASKLALSSSLEINQQLDKQPIDSIIFASQHGELSHTVNILNDLAKKNVLSPMEFSQAVHNTASGLFSIIEKINTPATSIACGKDTFLMAMLDALIQLNNKKNNILFTQFDENILPIYQSLKIEYNHAFSLSLSLAKFSSNDKNNHEKQIINLKIIDENSQIINKKQTKKTPPAIEFYHWLMSENNEKLTQTTTNHLFFWQKL